MSNTSYLAMKYVFLTLQIVEFAPHFPPFSKLPILTPYFPPYVLISFFLDWLNPSAEKLFTNTGISGKISWFL